MYTILSNIDPFLTGLAYEEAAEAEADAFLNAGVSQDARRQLACIEGILLFPEDQPAGGRRRRLQNEPWWIGSDFYQRSMWPPRPVVASRLCGRSVGCCGHCGRRLMPNHPNRNWRARMHKSCAQWLSLWPWLPGPGARLMTQEQLRDLMQRAYCDGYECGRKTIRNRGANTSNQNTL